MSFILDASVTIAWAREDEITPAIRHLFERLAESTAWVPSLWRLEVGNVLEFGVRRGRQTAEIRDEVLESLSRLPIEVDRETDLWAWNTTLYLAVKHRLTLYDAAYLELAIRLGLPLATLDRQLRAAASDENVPVLGE